MELFNLFSRFNKVKYFQKAMSFALAISLLFSVTCPSWTYAMAGADSSQVGAKNNNSPAGQNVDKKSVDGKKDGDNNFQGFGIFGKILAIAIPVLVAIPVIGMFLSSKSVKKGKKKSSGFNSLDLGCLGSLFGGGCGIGSAIGGLAKGAGLAAGFGGMAWLLWKLLFKKEVEEQKRGLVQDVEAAGGRLMDKVDVKIEKAGEVLEQKGKNLIAEAGQVVEQKGNALADKFSNIVDEKMNVIEQKGKNLIAEAGQVVEQKGNALADKFSNIVDEKMNVIEQKGNALADKFSNIADEKIEVIEQKGNAIVEKIKDTADGLLDKAKSIFEQEKEEIFEDFKKFSDETIDKAKEFIKELKDQLEELVDDSSDDLIKKADDFAKEQLEKIEEAGNRLLDKLDVKIDEKKRALFDQAETLVDHAKDKFVEGSTETIDKGLEKVEEFLEKQKVAIREEIKKAVEENKEGLKNILSSSVDKLIPQDSRLRTWLGVGLPPAPVVQVKASSVSVAQVVQPVAQQVEPVSDQVKSGDKIEEKKEELGFLGMLADLFVPSSKAGEDKKVEKKEEDKPDAKNYCKEFADSVIDNVLERAKDNSIAPEKVGKKIELLNSEEDTVLNAEVAPVVDAPVVDASAKVGDSDVESLQKNAQEEIKTIELVLEPVVVEKKNESGFWGTLWNWGKEKIGFGPKKEAKKEVKASVGVVPQVQTYTNEELEKEYLENVELKKQKNALPVEIAKKRNEKIDAKVKAMRKRLAEKATMSEADDNKELKAVEPIDKIFSENEKVKIDLENLEKGIVVLEEEKKDGKKDMKEICFENELMINDDGLAFGQEEDLSGFVDAEEE